MRAEKIISAILCYSIGSVLFGHYLAAGLASIVGVSVPVMAGFWLALVVVILLIGVYKDDNTE